MTQQFHSWVYIWKKMKTLIWKGTCTSMATETLLTMAKSWKQPKCPWTEDWIKKIQHTPAHTHRGILVIKRIKSCHLHHCTNIVPTEKAMAPHSSTLAWKISWTEEPGGLPSLGSHRVGHDWSDLTAAAADVPRESCAWWNKSKKDK